MLTSCHHIFVLVALCATLILYISARNSLIIDNRLTVCVFCFVCFYMQNFYLQLYSTKKTKEHRQKENIRKRVRGAIHLI